ncbi:MAG: ribosomal protein L7/L12 [Spiroplasmataceae bacterium]|jgi:large subunit ribosomal protein L7/L12|nr:ribosomal protein L7/L12 [Spiroplasmataceae bacterium]
MSEKNVVSKIREELKTLNLSQISELIDGVKEDFNIEETVMIQAGAVQANEEEKPQEKGGNVSLKLVKIDEKANKIKVYGEIKEAIKQLKGEEINIIQAKKLTEEGDKIILADIERPKAEDVKKKLAEAGVEVEIK